MNTSSSLLAAVIAATTLTAASAADLIIHNAKIVTADQRFSIAQAVAITGNRITATGPNAQILNAHKKPGTRVIDAQGKTILPGLIDAHVHVLSGGLSEFKEKLPKLDSFQAVQQYIRDKAKTTPAGQWIIVPRTFPTRLKEMRMPTRDILDVVTTHPVAFDASYVWVFNSYALKQNNITKATQDPPNGEIGRDRKTGEPNGILRNANSLIKNLPRNSESGQFTEADKLQAMRDQLNRYLRAGLTTIGDRAVSPDDAQLYAKLGRPPIRTVLTWRMPSTGDIPTLQKRVQNAPKLPDTVNRDWLKFDAFKVTLDGGMTIGTAYQRVPYGEFGEQLYGQTKPDSRGQLFIPPATLYEIMHEARKLGWALTAHSQGGGAIDALIETFEKLNKESPIADTRSHLMHASFQHPEAIAKLAKLGLPADVQPAWLELDGPALSKVFPNGGMRYFIPLGTYRKHGIILAGGSDHMIGHDKNSAINPYNPFRGMWTAVTRTMTDGNVLHPEERISRQDALRMYTTWAAYIQHADKDRGSIEPNKLADLVIIDRDYLTIPAANIKDIEPVTVILDGKVAWSK